MTLPYLSVVQNFANAVKKSRAAGGTGKSFLSEVKDLAGLEIPRWSSGFESLLIIDDSFGAEQSIARVFARVNTTTLSDVFLELKYGDGGRGSFCWVTLKSGRLHDGRAVKRISASPVVDSSGLSHVNQILFEITDKIDARTAISERAAWLEFVAPGAWASFLDPYR